MANTQGNFKLSVEKEQPFTNQVIKNIIYQAIKKGTIQAMKQMSTAAQFKFQTRALICKRTELTVDGLSENKNQFKYKGIKYLEAARF